MRICIAAGGTGGHISPGVSLYKNFKSKGFEVIFITNPHALKFPLIKEVVDSEHIVEIPISSGFTGNVVRNVKVLFEFVKSVVVALRTLRDFEPDKVVLTGGYSSAPVGVAAFLLGKDVVLLEQNSVMGLTNKILSIIAKIVILSFPIKGLENEKKFLMIGNPIRYSLGDRMIKDTARNILGFDQSERKLIGIVLGSQGAKNVNEFLCQNLAKLLENFDIVWITGENYYEYVQSRVKEIIDSSISHDLINLVQIKVFPFLTKMNIFFSAIDLAISRAGASTLSELSFFGVPSILIPFPYSAHNHQYYNARYFEIKGASVLIKEEELNIDSLLDAIDLIERNISIFSSNAKNIFPVDITNMIVDEIIKVR